MLQLRARGLCCTSALVLVGLLVVSSPAGAAARGEMGWHARLVQWARAFLRRHGRSFAALLLPLLAAGAVTAPDSAQAQNQPVVDGSRAPEACQDFRVSLLGLLDIANIPDPGWSLVANGIPGASRYRSVTGRVTDSWVSHTDFPATHQSHDQNTHIRVDQGFEGLLSNVGLPNDEDLALADRLKRPTTLGVEWETGVAPSEHGRTVTEGIFPHWAWPSVGDRIWANGDWIFDCGHLKSVLVPGGPLFGVPHAKTELHPLRAVASIRRQIRQWAPVGNHPAPVTAAELYIHGNGGFAVDVLNCGQDIILQNITARCGQHETPIREDFAFDIPAPPRPNPQARLVTKIENGPGNTVATPPQVVAHNSPVGQSRPFVRVTIPLRSTGVQPLDRYTRRIYVGWDRPPRVGESFTRWRVTLERMILKEDRDVDPGDCECTFFWANLPEAPTEWIRLADHADGNMNDYDDSHQSGDGVMRFSGAVWNFWLRSNESFGLRASGYDQDCIEDQFGVLGLDGSGLAACMKGSTGDNDKMADFDHRIRANRIERSLRMRLKGGDHYDLQVLVERMERYSSVPVVKG